MCGIVGITRDTSVAGDLIKYLKKLEYRGYDSAGAAFSDENGLDRVRRVGKIANLEKALEKGYEKYTCGIAHTRWATHGGVEERNAHPLFSSDGRVAVVHNGIIENAAFIKEKILPEGETFASDTDTEVIAHLISFYYENDPVRAVAEATSRLEGSYAIGVMFSDRPGEIYASSLHSPLVLAQTEDGSYLASDVLALPDRAKEIYRPGKGEIGVLSGKSVEFYDGNGNRLEKRPSEVGDSEKDVGKGSYEHYMLSEIMQQPEAVGNTLRELVYGGEVHVESVVGDTFISDKMDQIYIVACGSAYHTGLVAQFLFEKYSRVRTSVVLASEFRYASPILDKNTLVIFVSQSGETADTLAALRLVKETDAKTLSIVNVKGSSLWIESESSILTRAGREIAVATTKAYSAQLAAFYALALKFAYLRKGLSPEEYSAKCDALLELPEKIALTINMTRNKIISLAKRIKDEQSAFYIGRLLDGASAAEGSLKLKEVSYINSQCYAAGELKHGTLSLIEEGTPVIASITQSGVAAKTLSNVSETKARGAYDVVITFEKYADICKDASELIIIPETDEIFAPSLTVIPMQMLGYYTALYRGCDIDKPKNLAKSVTVE